MQVPNFAHGQLFMFGAYLSYTLVMQAGFHYWAAMAVAVATLARVPAPRSNGWCSVRSGTLRRSTR